MIITITLNPAIDVSYHSPSFEINQGHRVENGNKTAGGKGLNVSRVLKQLGSEPRCTGFLGGHSGSWIKERLNVEGLTHSFIEIGEETRTCLAILDEKSGTQTELMEKGPFIAKEERETFFAEFAKMLTEADFMIASGSLPRGLPGDMYREMAEMAHAANIPFLLDTSGEALTLGIQGKPFLIKPNKDELCQYAGKQDLSFDEMIAVAKEVCASGVTYVLISLGAEGAVLIGNDSVLVAEIPKISVVNPVGSGDSMVAGMAYGLQQQTSMADCLKWACACGMSNAMEATTGTIQIKVVKELLSKIKVYLR